MAVQNPYFFSIIVPVYNRPEELHELLQSLSRQEYKNFEVVVIEDGSQLTSEAVVKLWQSELSIQYIVKENTGPGPSRNVGFKNMQGEYAVVFDSDCIIPPHYLQCVKEKLSTQKIDAWGGPDKAHKDFTNIQKAMAYTMSAFLTTGGIRGGKKQIGKFQPRSFNMGISKKVIVATGGFAFARFAEDIELSIRMDKMGFSVVLLEEAYVFHKRRTNFKQFFKQVFNFGRGRVLVGKTHNGAIKLTHWFPSVFTLVFLLWPILFLFNQSLFSIAAFCWVIYFLAIFVGGAVNYSSIWVGFLCLPASIVQLTGYGLGFLKERLK